MSWKTLVIFATLAVGGLAGKYAIEGQKKVRLQQTLDNACQGVPYNDKDQIMGMAMGAFSCIYESVDDFAESSLPENATLAEQYLENVRQICSMRTRLRTCGQQLIEYLAPCTSKAVQAQIVDMKQAITELFGLFCDDDMANTKHFVDAGVFECMDKEKSHRFDNCTGDMFELVTDMPADTQSFEATEMCHSYDHMSSCLLNLVGECPNAYVKEFIGRILTLFRSGTYCRVTVPVGGNEVESSNVPE